MKKNLYLAIILSLSTLFNLLGQTTKKSLNYQAVILDPKSIDIPGASLSGQPLSKGKVCLKFTFVNAQGTVDYEEIQQTTTDEYGLVSISVGTGTYNAGTYKNFENIVWDANVKSMKVAVSYDGCNSFKQVSTQALNYTPYALYAEAVDYKNVKDAPTKLSQFSNDAGYLIPKDLDPIKADIKKNTDDIKTNTADIKTNSADIKTNAGQIASTIQTIAENKKASDDSFLIVKQSISDLGTKVVSNTNSIVTIEGKINEQQNLISDTRNQLNTATNTINGQINGLQNQVTTTANTVNSFSNEYQTVANKSTAINLGGGSPSDQLYPSQKAAKSYVDNAIYNAVGTGVADATTLAPGKVRLAGDLAGTANAPTVPALANKENTSNKSTNVNTDANSDTKYPSVKAIKTYVDQATQGIALQAAVDAKADKNSPIFTGTPSLPTGTIAVTQNGADNSTKLATTAFVQAATAAGIIDASSTTKGKLKLAGDLGGTAESPTVPGLALKANSADVTSSLALKENTSNKSTATALGTSDALYPSQKAVKTYVDAQIASATIVDADPSTKGKIQLAGDLGGTAAAPTVPGLALKANTSDVNTALSLKANTTDMNSALALKANSADVTSSLALKEDASNKSTATALGTSDALYPSQKAVKTYVDAQIASGAPDADPGTKGKIQLAGDLGGTAAMPTVPGLALKANSGDVTSSLALKEDASNKSTATALGTSDALYPSQKAVKTYVDAQIASGAPDADATTKGKLKLAGDLGGTAESPTVPGLALKANSADVTSSLALKEDASNKSTATALGTSDALYPSQKAVKTYVDAQIASVPSPITDYVTTNTSQNIEEAKSFSKDITVNGIRVGRGKNVSNENKNTAIGQDALSKNEGTSNTAIGQNALLNNTSGAANTAIGASSLQFNVIGGSNTAIGLDALRTNVGNQNTAVGRDALRGSGTGSTNNTAIGYQALRSTTSNSNTIGGLSGTGNTAIGSGSGFAITTGSNNITIGGDDAVGTGSYNTLVGVSAKVSSASTSNATAIGFTSKSAVEGTAIGNYAFALASKATAIGNGAYAGSNAANGTAIGNGANVDASNATAIGNRAIAGSNASNSTAIGYGAYVEDPNTIQLGADGTTDIDGVTIPAVTNVKTSGTVTANGTALTSDLRLKSNISPLGNSLATVMQLNPVHYMKKGSLASTAYTREENGFIAQEIQKILPFIVKEGTDENKLLSVDYNSFIPILTKAIQEQQKQIEDQNSKIAAQQKQIEELIKLVKGQ